MKNISTMLFFVICLYAKAQVCFGPPVNYTVGINPYGITCADLNNDGNVDIATANPGSSNISVILGTGTGTFGSPVNYTAGSNPYSIVSADFNGDGNIDLAAANENSDNVSVLLSTGTGSFNSAINYNVGTLPQYITCAYINGDGVIDLIIANQTSNNVSILFGTGTGSFSNAVNFSVGTSPKSVSCADLNNDSYTDLSVANSASNNVSVLLGTGTGNFGVATNYSVGTSPRSITIEDFNNDGNNDLAVANPNSNNFAVLLGNGTGSFGPAIYYTANATPISIANADFNGDGNNDLVTTNQSTNDLSVFLGTGTGSFSSSINFSLAAMPKWVNVGDFNNDSKTDLAVTMANSNKIVILLNTSLTINVGIDQTVCIGSSVSLSASGALTYTWSPSTGLSDSTGASVTATPLLTTTYTVMGTDSYGCFGTDQITVTVNPVLFSTISTSICQGDSILIGGNWQNTPGIYNDTLTATNSCDSILIITLNINPSAINNSIMAICQGDSAFLAGNWQSASGIFNDTLSTVTGCDSIIITALTVNPVIVNTISASICQGDSILIYGNWQCTSGIYNDTLTAITGCDSIISTNLTVNPRPLAEITGDTLICIGTTTVLTASGGTDYIWSTTDTSQTITVTPTNGATYTVTVTDDGCSSTAEINIFLLPLSNANAGNDTTIIVGAEVQLNATGGTIYQWIPSTYLDNPYISNPISEPSDDITYIVFVTDLNGCTGIDTVQIEVKYDGCIYVPNIFSPNGDGNNDLFYVRGKCISELYLMIFDRWGEEVFETNEQSEGWDGTYKGKEMNIGVFVWYLEAKLNNGDTVIKKGNVTLVR